MKRILLSLVLLPALLALLPSPPAAAQVTATMTIDPYPHPSLSEWVKRRQTIMLMVTNAGGAPVNARFKVVLTRDGARQAYTKTESMPVVTLPALTSSWTAEQLIPFSAVGFDNDVDRTTARTGSLPAGLYEVCVDILAADGPMSGSSLLPAGPVCRMMNVTAYQPPQLIQPYDGEVLDARQRPVFRWTPMSPRVRETIWTTIAVFEVLTGQSPQKALRSNRPILLRSVQNATQLIWPADVQFPVQSLTTRSPQFIWTARCSDGAVIDWPTPEDPDGLNWSEPATFRVEMPSPRGSTVGDTGRFVDPQDPPDDPEGILVPWRQQPPLPAVSDSGSIIPPDSEQEGTLVFRQQPPRPAVSDTDIIDDPEGILILPLQSARSNGDTLDDPEGILVPWPLRPPRIPDCLLARPRNGSSPVLAISWGNDAVSRECLDSPESLISSRSITREIPVVGAEKLHFCWEPARGGRRTGDAAASCTLKVVPCDSSWEHMDYATLLAAIRQAPGVIEHPIEPARSVAYAPLGKNAARMRGAVFVAVLYCGSDAQDCSIPIVFQYNER